MQQPFFQLVQCQQTDVKVDAQRLRTAMKGVGTDEKEIIKVASEHTWQQRIEIARTFTAMFGLDFYKELHKETSGHFHDVILGVFHDRYEYWAECIHEAIKGYGTDEKRLIQLVIIMSDQDAAYVKMHYQRIYQKDLYHQISKEIGNSDWARLLRAWILGENKGALNPEQGADLLYKAAKGAGTDEDVFINILSNCTPQIYAAICQTYQAKYKKVLRETIKAEFSAKSEFAFLLAHDYLLNPADGIAFLLHKSIQGAGTDEQSLNILTVLYSDYMRGPQIIQSFTKYGDLKKQLKKDLNGDYERAILMMWGLK